MNPAPSEADHTAGTPRGLLGPTLAGWLLLPLALAFAHRRLGFEFRDPIFLSIGLAAVGWGWRRLLRRARECGASGWLELVRVATLVAAGLWAVYPFLTATFVGGIDAAWYLRVLADHLEQARAGVFPVLVGQGEYQFNGAVHPYRFAPFYQNLAGLLDVLTGRQLTVVVLQHATVAFSSLVAALGAYGALSARAPRARWTAWLVSLCLVLSPAVLALLCIHDMYMSFLAAAWIPVAFHAALRLVETRTLLSAAKLAAVLAIILNSHPPVGLWTAAVSLGVATLALACGGAGWRTLTLPVGALVALYALNAFQFQGISEISPVGGLSVSRPAAAALIGTALCAAGATWIALRLSRRGADDSGAQAGGQGAVGERNALIHSRAVLVAAAAAVLSLTVVRVVWPAPTPVGDAMVAFTRNFWPGVLLPVHQPAGPLSDVQPGWAVLSLGLFGLAVAWWVDSVWAKLFAVVGALLALCLLPFSPFTAAFWNSVPVALIASTSGAVNLRISPVWTVAMAFAGFGALVWLKARAPWVFRPGFAALVLLAGWSVREAWKIQKFSVSLTRSAPQTDDLLRPENSVLTIYSGNFIGLPPYFSHGVRDCHLESRLLDPASGEVKPELAVGYVLPEPTARLTLRAEPDPALPGWLRISPEVNLAPGERLRLTFAFGRSDWAGILVIEGPSFYREYILPASGSDKAFGCGPGNGRDLVLWSTAPAAQALKFRFRPEPSMANGMTAQDFATVEVRPLDPQALPVRTMSLVPAYRAQVTVSGPAVLETPRTWVPGYAATRNGQPVQVAPSAANLVSVPLVAGPNTVELNFVGSRRVQTAFVVSVSAWVIFFAAWLADLRRRRVIPIS